MQKFTKAKQILTRAGYIYSKSASGRNLEAVSMKTVTNDPTIARLQKAGYFAVESNRSIIVMQGIVI